jgi:DNA-binding MarR family transcriptional regulator
MNDLSPPEPPHALLHGLRAAVAGEVGSGDDLTLRQMAAVLIVYLADDPQTVRSLARHLKMRTTAVSQMLNRLGRNQLGMRLTHPNRAGSNQVAPLERVSLAVPARSGWVNVFPGWYKLGLVRRQVDPVDRRSVFVVRTETGRAMVARLKASLAAAADGPG